MLLKVHLATFVHRFQSLKSDGQICSPQKAYDQNCNHTPKKKDSAHMLLTYLLVSALKINNKDRYDVGMGS